MNEAQARLGEFASRSVRAASVERGASRSEEPAGIAVTVAVPVTERPESLAPLYEEYAAPLKARGEAFEFLFLMPPWGRELGEALDPLVRQGEPIRVLELGQSLQEAALLKLAAAHARGDVLVTLPAYYRIDARGLPELIDRVRAGTDMAVARRWPRRDPRINRLQTRVFHRLITGVARRGGELQDIACGVRALRPQVLSELAVYGDSSRFLPLLALQEGWDVEEVDVPQHPRDARTRVYGPGTYVRRLIDVLGVLFLLRFTYKPLRFFGLVGSAFSAAGGLILLVLFVQRLAGQGIADRPLLLLGVLLLTFGVQAVALGLVGEMIVHLHAPDRRAYRLRGPESGGSKEDKNQVQKEFARAERARDEDEAADVGSGRRR